MTIELEHLPGDVFPLSAAQRTALSGRPRPYGARSLVVPVGVHDLGEGSCARDATLEATCQRIEERLAPLEPPVAALDALRSLTQPGATAIVTVVPAGLCGGSLTNAWRALHTLRLARLASQERGRPVVPILYLDATAPDAERDLWWVGEHFDLVRLCLSSMGHDASLGAVLMDEERHRMRALRERIRQLASSLEVDAELDALAPRAGETFVDASARALLDVFGGRGVVIVRPEWLGPELARALARCVGSLPTPPPEAESKCAPAVVRAVDRSGVRELRVRAEGFIDDSEPGSRTATELAAEIVDQPDLWVPAEALAVPALASLLPLAAEVGDAARLDARLAGISAEPHPVPFVPLQTATLVDPASGASLQRLDQDLAELFRSGRAAREVHAPPEVLADLRSIAERTRSDLLAQRQRLREFDPGLGQRLRRVAAEANQSIEALCKRAERLHANRTGKEKRHMRRVEAWLCPGGRPQAGALSLLQALAVWGRDWLDVAEAELDPFPTEHLVLRARSTE